jgi:translation initiation factor IF-3
MNMVRLVCCFLLLSIATCFVSNLRSVANKFEGSFYQIFSTIPGRDSRRPVIPPPPINNFIKADRVRLIIPGNETADNDIMVGILPLQEAIEYAERLQVDLVMINEKGDPPVCKAIDYGKFKYIIEKKKKENAKKQVQSEIKEVKMSHKIEQHDFDVRVRSIQKFIEDGDRVNNSQNI